MNLLVLEFEIDLLSLQARVNYAKWVTGRVGRTDFSFFFFFLFRLKKEVKGWMGEQAEGG